MPDPLAVAKDDRIDRAQILRGPFQMVQIGPHFGFMRMRDVHTGQTTGLGMIQNVRQAHARPRRLARVKALIGVVKAKGAALGLVHRGGQGLSNPMPDQSGLHPAYPNRRGRKRTRSGNRIRTTSARIKTPRKAQISLMMSRSLMPVTALMTNSRMP